MSKELQKGYSEKTPDLARNHSYQINIHLLLIFMYYLICYLQTKIPVTDFPGSYTTRVKYAWPYKI